MLIAVPDVAQFEARAGEPVAWVPRLDVSALGVLAGPYRDGTEHEKHALAAIGSGDWYRPAYDELLFDAESRMLASLWSHLPEERLEEPSRLSAWTELDAEPSSLRLAGPSRFELPPAGRRWCPESGELLVWTYPDLPAHPAEPRRIRIAPNLDLLVSEGTLRGYLLADPARFLTSGWAPPGRETAEPGVAALLAEVFDTVAGSAVELMEDEDEGMRARLRALDDRIAEQAGDTDGGRILREHIARLIETFYG